MRKRGTKQIIVNTLLILSFMFIGAVIILPFLAEIQLKVAKIAESRYDWKVADKHFRMAISFSALNAEYHAELGRAYASRAAILKNKIPDLLRAETEYTKACELNPYNAKCLAELAAIKVGLLLADKSAYANRITDAIVYFKKASEIDPNNYIVNYNIGRNFLTLWDYLNDADKQFALDRFRQCIIARPVYCRRVYNAIWSNRHDFDVLLAVTPEGQKYYEILYNFIKRNNLWKYRKKLLVFLNKYDNSENRLYIEEADEIKEKYFKKNGAPVLNGQNLFLVLSEWEGVSIGKKNIYKNGNMYWTGTMHRLVYLPPNIKNLIIKARGSQANGECPYMIVRLDGEEIGATYIDSAEWLEYRFEISDEGIRVLSITFVNDGGNKQRNEDRNLYISEVWGE